MKARSKHGIDKIPNDKKALHSKILDDKKTF